MGDYSRDTFRQTNTLHQFLTGESVADPRHYVGVRMQQGVPLIDADWNELEDIRNLELRAVLGMFIGNGVPTQSAGFGVSETAAANDFAIGPGIALVQGLIAVSLALTSYSTQPNAAGLPALTTPAADRVDTVYLDIWHEEVRAVGSAMVDERLVNLQIGVESAARIVRRWVVRVREGAADLAGLPVPAGHRFWPIASLRRRAGAAAVREAMIVDLRRPGLTVSDFLKAPIFVRRGLEVLNVPRFVQMVAGLRTVLFTRLSGGLLPFQTGAPDAQRKESLILMAQQDLSALARLGERQAATHNLDNADALGFMGELYDGQSAWIDLLESIGNEGGVAQAFVNGYRQRLDNSPPAPLIKGLKPALDQSDLLAAVIAQEELNLWLTAPTGELPEGSVDALYQSVIPVENLTAGASYDFTYRVEANFTSPDADEDFQVQITLPASFGTASADPPTLTLAPPDQEAEVVVTVVPSGVAGTGDLDVAVFAARNATLRSPQPPITLTLGAPPPVAAFFYYAGARFNAEGLLEIPQNHLTRAQGRNVLFRLQNGSATLTRSYQVTGQIVPNVAVTTGWSPLAPTALPTIVLAPSSTNDVNVRVDGPKSPAAPAPVGTTGNIIAVATLTLEGGAPPADPPAPITITVPFIVV